MSEDVVSVDRVIPAPPEKIFELLVYPDKHQLIDGSGSVRDAKGDAASERLKLGSKFGMKMKMGLPYSMTSTVVEFEEGRRIAWQMNFMANADDFQLGPNEIWVPNYGQLSAE